MITNSVFVIRTKYMFYVLVIVRCVDTSTSLTLYIQRGGDMFVFTLSLLYFARSSQLYNDVVLQ